MTRDRPIGRLLGCGLLRKINAGDNSTSPASYLYEVICPSNASRRAPVVAGIFAGNPFHR